MTDILLCPFSIPPKEAIRAIAQPVDLLTGGAITKPINMASCTDFNEIGGCKQSDAARFADTAKKLRNPSTGRILPNLLKTLGLGNESGRLGLISFSAGRAATQEILQSDADQNMLDVVMDLDGIHFPRLPSGLPTSYLSPWTKFGTKCLDGSKLLVTLHTAIVPANSADIYSTTETNAMIWNVLDSIAATDSGKKQMTPNLAGLTAMAGNWPVTVAGQAGDTDHTWTQMPAFSQRNAGNAFSLGMPGATAGAHIFACYWGQGAIWRAFLVPRWNGCAVARPSMSAQGVPSVTVYTSAGCGYCTQAKSYLTAKGVQVIEKDFDANKTFIQAKASTYGVAANAVPVLDFGNAVQVGFNPAAIDAALAGSGGSGSDPTALCLPSSYFHMDDIAEDTAADKRWADGTMPSVGEGDEPGLQSSTWPWVVGVGVAAGLGWLILRSKKRK